MAKQFNLSSVKVIFGLIYTIITILGFSLIAIILPSHIGSKLDTFFNDTLVPGIKQDGNKLSNDTRELLITKKESALAFADSSFTQEKEAIVEGYANIIMPIVESYDTDLLEVTVKAMLKEVDALEGIQLKIEKDEAASKHGDISTNSELTRHYKKVIESEFTYVELIMYFSTEKLLNQIKLEELSFNQQLDNIESAVDSIISSVESETEIAQNKILSDTRFDIILSAIMAVIALSTVSILLLHMILVKRLLKANEILHSIAEGDLTGDIIIGRKDEIGGLFVSMKRMQQKIAQNIELTLKNGQRLSKSSMQLLSMSDESKEGINNQHNQIETVVTSIDTMSSASHSVSEKIASASQAAEESLKKSTIGKQNVEKMILTIDDLSKDIKDSEELIHTLSHESKAISSILDVITGISEKTNLLALNAAIEAARAGESGRGFAVVADEVRALASSTKTSADDIRRMVERLSQQTENAVTGMEKSRNNADSAVKEIYQTGEVIQSLSSSISLMNDINADIISSVNEQSAMANEINQNITTISGIGTNNADIALNVSAQVQELNDISIKLQDLVSYFNTKKHAR